MTHGCLMNTGKNKNKFSVSQIIWRLIASRWLQTILHFISLNSTWKSYLTGKFYTCTYFLWFSSSSWWVLNLCLKIRQKKKKCCWNWNLCLGVTFSCGVKCRSLVSQKMVITLFRTFNLYFSSHTVWKWAPTLEQLMVVILGVLGFPQGCVIDDDDDDDGGNLNFLFSLSFFIPKWLVLLVGGVKHYENLQPLQGVLHIHHKSNKKSPYTHFSSAHFKAVKFPIFQSLFGWQHQVVFKLHNPSH